MAGRRAQPGAPAPHSHADGRNLLPEGVGAPCWLPLPPPQSLWLDNSGQIPACRTWELSAPQKVHHRPEDSEGCGVQPRPAPSAEGLTQGQKPRTVPVPSRGSETCVLTRDTARSSRDDDPPCGQASGPPKPTVRDRNTETGVQSLSPPQRAWAAVARSEPLHPRTRAWPRDPARSYPHLLPFFPTSEGTMTFSSQQGDMVPQTPSPLSPRRLAAACHSLLEGGHTRGPAHLRHI